MNKNPGALHNRQVDDEATAAPSVPFLSVDLPPQQALRLAEGRPIIRLSAASIGQAEFPRDPALRLGCPLFGSDSDAMCIAEALSAAGFPGEMLVLAPRLPNPALVEKELRAAAHGFRLRLICD